MRFQSPVDGTALLMTTVLFAERDEQRQTLRLYCVQI